MTTAKKKKDGYEINKDVICLPMHELIDNEVIVPRGKARTTLGKLGLMGKLRLNSEMTPDQVKREVRSVFSEVMMNKEDFKFTFLQSAGKYTYLIHNYNHVKGFIYTRQLCC